MLASIAFGRWERLGLVAGLVVVGAMLAVWVLENSKNTQERLRKRMGEMKRKAGEN